MKELSTEEKAKRYDEAIEKATALYKAAEPMSGCNVLLETVFPELKESEDERIRKELIAMVKLSCTNGDDVDKKIAWLEKQGEQKSTNNQFTPEQADILDKHIDEFIKQKPTKWSEEDEKQGEQNPAEWPEDWSEEDENIFENLIELIQQSNEEKGTKNGFAKFRNRLKSLKLQNTLKPSAWSEEDKKISSAIIKKLIGSSDALCVDLQSAIGWVKNIKDRVQPKQEWNEDDALKIDFVSKLLTGLDQEKYDSQCMKELSSWLQSLKGRVQPQSQWKPSDEQMKALKEACDEHWEPDGLDPLYTLYQDLKKLI